MVSRLSDRFQDTEDGYGKGEKQGGKGHLPEIEPFMIAENFHSSGRHRSLYPYTGCFKGNSALRILCNVGNV